MVRLPHVFLTTLMLAFTVACLAQSSNPAAFSEGQKVEVREGDVWSQATILKKEGRRYQIHYQGDNTNNEWVTADRLRAPGTAASAPASSPAKPEAAAAIPWVVGQKVEVKWGGMWFKATIVKRQGDWSQVKYDQRSTFEWIEPYRIRQLDSKEDNIGSCSPNPVVRGNEGPPRDKPGAAPAPFGFANRDKETSAENFTADPAFKNADWSGSSSIAINAPAGAVLAPDPATALTPSAAGAITLAGNNAGEKWQTPSVIVQARGTQMAFIGVMQGYATKYDFYVERVDLVARKSAGVFSISPNTKLIAAAPDGKSFLARSDAFGFNTFNRLELWTIDGQAAKRTAIWFPYDKGDIESAFFVDVSHVLTADKYGKIGLWDTATGKAIWTASALAGSAPAISPGGKYLAILTAKSVLILEPLSGKAIAEYPSSGAAGQLAFSPSGKQLAASDGRNFQVWDVIAGKLTSEFSLGSSVGTALTLPTDGYALLNGANLVDLERRIHLWQYTGAAGAAAIAPGWACFLLSSTPHQPVAVTLAAMPSPEALAAAKSLKADDLLLLRPGAKVSLDLGAASGDAAIVDHIKNELATRGMEIADGQPVRLVVRVEAGKTQKMSFRRVGGLSHGVEEVQVTPQHVKLIIESDGKKAWETSSYSGVSMMLDLKPGQSAQQAADEATKPNFAFLKTVRLPTYLAKVREQAGSSALR